LIYPYDVENVRRLEDADRLKGLPNVVLRVKATSFNPLDVKIHRAAWIWSVLLIFLCVPEVIQFITTQ